MTRKILGFTALLLAVVMVQPLVLAHGLQRLDQITSGTTAPPAAGASPRLIVELTSPPLANYAVQAAGSAGEEALSAEGQQDLLGPDGRLNTDAPPAARYTEKLAREQDAFLTELASALPGASVAEYSDESGREHPLRFAVVFNGVAVDPGPTGAQVAESRIAALPQVKNVYHDYAHDLDLYASLPLINAAATWNVPSIGGKPNAGKGIKIASLDAGIHHLAPMFDGTGYAYPPGYPKGDARNTNGKIIASRAYFRDWDPPLPTDADAWPGPNSTSHGVHTSSTAGGIEVQAHYYGVTETLSGVAPASWLMSYRVFYASVNGISSMYSAEGIAALEDIVKDGADIINNSWGAGPDSIGGAYDPLDAALLNAWHAGLFVTMSEGNGGPNIGTGDHSSSEYINVANTSTAGTFRVGALNVTAPEPVPENLTRLSFAPATFGAELPAGGAAGPLPYLPSAVVDPANIEGCTPWPEKTFDGKIAMIKRGNCEFGAKVLYAEQAGARYVVVYNHEAGGDALVNMAAGTLGVSVTIGSAFIGLSNGERIVAWQADHPDAELEVSNRAFQVGNTPDVVNAGSSRGPGVGNRLKPEIAAPGTNILAQGYGPGTGIEVHFGYGQASGTSMSAPHVSGAAALVKQAHPDWPNDWIKSALMSTSRYTDVVRHDGRPAQPLDIGAGRLDLTEVTDPGIILDPPLLSFGQTYAGSSPSITVTVTSVSDSEEQYQLSTVYTADSFTSTTPVPGLSLSMRSITVPAHGTRSFTVSWDASSAAGMGDNQGYVLLTGTTHRAHMPAWIRIGPAPADKYALIIDNDGSSMPVEVLAALGITEPYQDYVGVYTRTLEADGYSYDVWDADARSGTEPTTLPDPAAMSGYRMVIYETGDYSIPDSATPGYTPPTSADMMRLVEYVNAGGRLLVFGQDFSQACGLPDSSPWLYGVTIGATFVQDSVTGGEVLTDTYEVVAGLPDTVYANLALDLSALGDGAGNQAYVDEILPASGSEALMKYALAGQITSGGVVAVSSRDEPSLERPGISWLGRTMYFAFGLEGINEDTGFMGRSQFIIPTISWLLDEVSVSIEAEVHEVGSVSYFTPILVSDQGFSLVSQRWDFGDGTPPTDLKSVGVSPAGHLYRAPGRYTVMAELHDAIGNVGIGQLEVVVEGEVPTAVPIEHMVFLPWNLHTVAIWP